MASVFIPTTTQDGFNAATNADKNGLSFDITHVAFGDGQYIPTGSETALQNELARSEFSGASTIGIGQFRVIAAWADDEASGHIHEIGLYANDVLFAVWSRIGDPIGYKAENVDYVLFNDFVFQQVPANILNIVVNPDLNVALAALMTHEGADNAHPQYMRKNELITTQNLLNAEYVTGTANALVLTMQVGVDAEYIEGAQFTFIANANNTGACTINVNSLGVKPLVKTGGVPLSTGDILAGGAYRVFYDGDKFQIFGASGGSGVAAEALKLRNPFKINGVDVDGSQDVVINTIPLRAATASMTIGAESLGEMVAVDGMATSTVTIPLAVTQAATAGKMIFFTALSESKITVNFAGSVVVATDSGVANSFTTPRNGQSFCLYRLAASASPVVAGQKHWRVIGLGEL